jgi:hypothetical protein
MVDGGEASRRTEGRKNEGRTMTEGKKDDEGRMDDEGRKEGR